MKAGVGSRGSPMPKSISSSPDSTIRRRASSSRTNGYVGSVSSTGERRVTEPRLPGCKAAKRLEAPLEVRDRNLLVCTVRVGGRAGPEVHRVESALRELRHGRPRLLRRNFERAGLDEAPRER